ncbi:Cof-type HAD-IIB family hydrolase [Alkalibaculum bacchi]|uniref:Cof-type HAD-IIB family hydrolase n=1 Tax=Alkalibaculum bacchi TaxID=645887 RepID=UPI0026EC2271|nr:Cof-type HAD-IIB family hydrolase [Alkalibaculum bacchi]
MDYKLIAVDIDGTLLNSQGILTKKTKKAIQEAVDVGVVFVICTGRPIQGVKSLNEEINRDLPFITYNGAMVIKGKSKEILYQRSLPKNLAKEVYDIGSKWNTTMIIWSDNKLYVNHENDKAKEYSKSINTPYIKIDSIDEIPTEITKILWYDEPEKLSKHQADFKEKIDKRIVHHFSRPFYLEFVDEKATKGIAIQKLCEDYGFDIAQTIAIGDGYNDLSMIQEAGLGVAMENAPDDIKKHAQYITTSCDEDGVANVIYKFLLDKE